MRPSEIIRSLYLENSLYTANNIFSDDEVGSWMSHIVQSILDYLDEEAKKAKYVCPKCYRVVDELREYAELDTEHSSFVNYVDLPFSTKMRKACKYCV